MSLRGIILAILFCPTLLFAFGRSTFNTDAASRCSTGEYLDGDGNCVLGTTLGHGDGTDCAAGQSPLGVDNLGNATGCFDVQTSTEQVAHEGDASAHHTKTTDASELTTGTLPNARLDSSSVTLLGSAPDHDSLSNVTASQHHTKTTDASELTTGTLPNARLDSSSVTLLGSAPDHDSLSNVTANQHHTPTVDTNTNADTECSGTTTYFDGEGNCDDIAPTYVDASGDTMSGDLNLGDNQVTNVSSVTTNGSATIGGQILASNGSWSRPSIAFATANDTGFNSDGNHIYLNVNGVRVWGFRSNGQFRAESGFARLVLKSNHSETDLPIQFENDPDTGLLQKTAGSFYLVTNGSQRMLLESDGTIGLGTSPDVSSFTAAGFLVLDNGARIDSHDNADQINMGAGGIQFVRDAANTIDTNTNNRSLTVRGGPNAVGANITYYGENSTQYGKIFYQTGQPTTHNPNTVHQFNVRSPAGSERTNFVIDYDSATFSNVNVGMGTVSPSERLDVVGNIAVSGNVDGVDVSAHAADASAHHTKTTDASELTTGTLLNARLDSSSVTLMGQFNYAGSSSKGGAATTAVALNANPTDCSANQFANAIDASGNLTCASIALQAGVDDLTIKSVSENVSSSIVLQDDDELTAALSANSDYHFELVFIASSTSDTPDLTWGFSIPTGSTITVVYAGSELSGTPVFGTMRGPDEGDIVNIKLTDDSFVRASGTLQTAGSAGNLVFRWAQRLSAADATTVQRGSYLKVIKD